MKGPGDPIGAALRQYRDLTAGAADGAATRSRVLATVDHRRRSRDRLRSWSAVAIFGIVVAGSAALAAAQVARWTRPAAVALPEPAPLTGPRSAEGDLRPRRVIPAVPPASTDDQTAAENESRWYGAAHVAHFSGGDPRRAVAAWNHYLIRYPHGVFEPEARFNRAVCLVRLGLFEQASASLAPFANGRFGAYRRDEAQRLLDWVGQPTLPAAPVGDMQPAWTLFSAWPPRPSSCGGLTSFSG